MFKDFFDSLKGEEVVDSIKKSLEEKWTSPVYGVLIFSWLIVHWKFIYTALFVSEEKIWEKTQMLKSDYLSSTFLTPKGIFDLKFYIPFLLPFFLSFLLIWYFPKYISIPALKKYREFEDEKIEMKFKTQKNILSKKDELSKLNEQTLRREKEVKKEEKEIKKIEKEIDPTIEWADDLKTVISNDALLNALRDASRVIYQSHGKFTGDIRSNNPGYTQYISPSSLSRLDALNLIKISPEKRDVMEFTDKGKFFIREFQKINQLT